MKVVVFHGSPRKGNTYTVTMRFMDELLKCGDISFSEFFFPKDIPEYCMGCQICLGNSRDKCPHANYVNPIYRAIMEADALVFSAPHYGACCMPGSMKNLFDHLDFLAMTIAPRKEMFRKKAFVLTTGSGSAYNIKIIRKCLKNWGINRVSSMGIRMFTDKWKNIPAKRQKRLENRIRKSARKLYFMKKKFPYISTILMYYLNKFIIKKFVGEGNYPYEFWKEHGYFDKPPF